VLDSRVDEHPRAPPVIHVGTSGYNYPEWKGSFYPVDLPASRMLAYYGARFSTVEINYTFYRMPTPKAVAGWAAAVPPSFTFALKAPQRITHMRRLRDIDEPLAYFRDVARSLRSQLGPLLFQLPPTFRKATGRLGDLLAQLPRELRVAFEFRHHSWFDDDVYEVLRAWNGALCVADTEKGTTPLVATADFGYLRLRDADYTDAELGEWAARLRATGWRDAYVYFKHEESGTGPALASRLRRTLGDELVTPAG
jgi:uncharacterized protein YecE (DUF72 family)